MILEMLFLARITSTDAAETKSKPGEKQPQKYTGTWRTKSTNAINHVFRRRSKINR